MATSTLDRAALEKLVVQTLPKAHDLARRLGHLAVIVSRGPRGPVEALDGWVPLPRGATILRHVSVTGIVQTPDKYQAKP